MEPTDTTERARGLMVGIATGNLLGIVQEGWSRRRVAEAFPDGVREIAADIGYPDDDDLAQAIVIAEAAEQGPLDPGDLGRRLWEWAETNGLGMGGLTGHVLELYGGDVPSVPGRERAGRPEPRTGRHGDHRGVTNRVGRIPGRQRSRDALRPDRDSLA